MEHISREEEEGWVRKSAAVTNKSLWKISKRDLFANIEESKSETNSCP